MSAAGADSSAPDGRTSEHAAAPPFRRVLVANRGEIAVRICRGLSELDVEAVTVHSDADRGAAHVWAGGPSVAIGGEAASDSYLRIDKILEAARASGADAIHPGYGFLSENADFARAVEAAGLTFIGPTAAAMELLGPKKAARGVARAAGVPVVPGFDGDRGDDPELCAEAERIGFPLLVKASAGGGGKGMRIVTAAADLADAVAAGRREARAAFGDDRMVLEKLVAPARHVEIQILGDAHGDVVALGERECSVQRRHQKVLEEAPSPIVDPDLRARMGAAAVAIGRSVGYRNAGTVEFLVDEAKQFYFLEVNTRLQVEHPVTELVLGLDLVHLQVRLAGGARLADLLAGRDLTPRGHAIEARICAEAPEQGFLPAVGDLQLVVEPRSPGVRIDSGVHTGARVSVHYDPLLAKLIVHAPDRATACRRLAAALADCTYLGLPTNVDFLRRVVLHPDFRAGLLSTDFLDRRPELASGSAAVPPDDAFVAAALAALLAGGRGDARGDAGAGGVRGVNGAARRGGDAWRDIGALRLWEDA